MKKKIIYFIFFLILIILFVIIAFLTINNENKTSNEDSKYAKNVNDDIKINTSEELKEEIIFNNLKFSNIELIRKDGMTIFLADIQNMGEEKAKAQVVKISFINENELTIKEVEPHIRELLPNEVYRFSIGMVEDIVDIKKISIKEP